jgi:ferredoxin
MNGVMEMVLQKAPDYFDMVLIAMAMLPAPGNPAGEPATEKGKRFLANLKAFRQKGIGIMSMKSGAKQALGKGAAVFQPHVKAVLEAGADTIVTSISTFEHADLVTKLDLKSPHLKPAERQAADDFRRGRRNACLMCADCTRACPQGVPISDLMRIRMYHEECGWPDHARAEFGALGLDAGRLGSSCGDCTACSAVCPVGLAGPRAVGHVASLFS